MPIRSGARQRVLPATCGITLRHRYDEAGLPCRNTTGSAPGPESVYAIQESLILTVGMVAVSSP